MAFTPDQAEKLIMSAAGRGRLPHALLITGSPESGTYTLVLRLAHEFTGASAEDISKLLHPMCRVIKPSSKLRTITIQAVREVEPFLAMRAEEGATKLVLVCEADRLSDDSANAFLKTLEEPPPQTLIILVTHLPERLLPTIRSRCIRLDLMEPMSCSVHLTPAQQKFLPAVQSAMAHMGSDVAALALRADFQTVLEHYREDITRRITSALKEESKAYSEGTDVRDWEARQKDVTSALIETEYLSTRVQMLELLQICFRQAVLLASHAVDVVPLIPELERVAQQSSIPDLLARIKAMDNLSRDLSFNVQETLALAARFTQIIGSNPYE